MRCTCIGKLSSTLFTKPCLSLLSIFVGVIVLSAITFATGKPEPSLKLEGFEVRGNEVSSRQHALELAQDGEETTLARPGEWQTRRLLQSRNSTACELAKPEKKTGGDGVGMQPRQLAVIWEATGKETDAFGETLLRDICETSRYIQKMPGYDEFCIRKSCSEPCIPPLSIFEVGHFMPGLDVLFNYTASLTDLEFQTLMDRLMGTNVPSVCPGVPDTNNKGGFQPGEVCGDTPGLCDLISAGIDIRGAICALFAQTTGSCGVTAADYVSLRGVRDLLPDSVPCESVPVDKIDALRVPFAKMLSCLGIESSTGITDRWFRPDQPQTNVTSAVFQFGITRNRVQTENFIDKVCDYLQTRFDEKNKDFNLYFKNKESENQARKDMLQGDLLVAIGAVMYVFLYMWFTLRSLFLASMGMLQILLSFPLALFFYMLLFGYKVINVLHFVSIFVILGIGADDIFVFFDHWKASGQKVPKNGDDWRAKRFDWSFSHAASAMLVTSITTVVAFAANITSVVAPIRAFGVWAAALIGVNYLLVCSFFPAAVAFYQAKFEQKGFCGTRLCAPKEEEGEGGVERFFREKYAPFAYRMRWVLLLMFLALIGVFGFFTTQLQNPDADPSLWKSNSNPYLFNQVVREQIFSEDSPWVSMVWGLKAVDNGNLNDPNDLGTVEWDLEMDLSLETSQQAMLDACRTLAADPALTQPGESNSQCSIKSFDAWLLANSLGSLPLPPADFNTLLKQYITTPNAQPVYPGGVNFCDPGDGKVRICFVVARFLSSMSGDPTFDEVTANFDAWEKKTDELNAAASAGFNKGYHTSEEWVRNDFHAQLKNTALSSIGLSLLLAFVVLTLFTGNLLIALLACISIGSIVLGICAFIVWSGWSLGVIESVNLAVLVGMSVDYVVHLAHAFTHAHADTRQEKAQIALTEIGVSVLSGAVSTFGAGVFMVCCQNQFFYQFGLFILIAIFLSFFFSIGFFMTLCAILGPVGSMGDVSCICKRLCGKKYSKTKGAVEMA